MMKRETGEGSILTGVVELPRLDLGVKKTDWIIRYPILYMLVGETFLVLDSRLKDD